MTAALSDAVRDQRDYPKGPVIRKDLATSVARKLEAANVIDAFGTLFILCVIPAHFAPAVSAFARN
jgi:hypothetical protein